MQPNNNLLAEISALVLASLLIIAGGVLLFFGKVDPTYATFLFTLAAGIFGFKIVAAAPSPAQQNQLAALTAQALSTQAQPASTPVAAPQFVPNPIDPKFGTMPQAMLTTMTGIPAVKPPQ